MFTALAAISLSLLAPHAGTAWQHHPWDGHPITPPHICCIVLPHATVHPATVTRPGLPVPHLAHRVVPIPPPVY